MHWIASSQRYHDLLVDAALADMDGGGIGLALVAGGENFRHVDAFVGQRAQRRAGASAD